MQNVALSNLPEDVLSRIVRALMDPVRVCGVSRIVEKSYVAALPLALSCKLFHRLFYVQLVHCELWQSETLDDRALSAIAKNAASSVRRIVLRKCHRISIQSLSDVAQYCTRLRVLDLSYVPLTDEHIHIIMPTLGASLTSLHLRACSTLTDRALISIATNSRWLHFLDISELQLVTDHAIEYITHHLGYRLHTFVCSGCVLLSDLSLESIAHHCDSLQILTCRRLPCITNEGVYELCRQIGANLITLDILDCDQLQLRPFLQTVGAYCPRLSRRFHYAESRTLRQVVISSLSGYIFHVTGSDIHNGKAAVYFLLSDAGTTDSFRVSVGSSVSQQPPSSSAVFCSADGEYGILFYVHSDRTHLVACRCCEQGPLHLHTCIADV